MRYFDAGVEIAHGLLPGSYASITAVVCAGLVAMQAPLGQYLEDPFSVASLPRVAWPDNRLAVIRRARLRMDEVDLDVPPSWISDRVMDIDVIVSDQQRQWGLVARAYDKAFQGLLNSEGMVSQPYDEVDPAVVEWVATCSKSTKAPPAYTGASATCCG